VPVETPAPRCVLIEYTLEDKYDDTGAMTRAIFLMYNGTIGKLPAGVVDCRIVALDGVYRPNAEELDLHK